MGVMTRVKRLIGGGNSSEAAAEEEEPSHVCQTCGEEYFTDPSVEISECRSCGGIRVERADAA